MAAFDVTTKPPQQSAAPGSSVTVLVTVSNRLGKPVMARVSGIVSPAAAAAWLTSPEEPQRKFEADPSATLNFEFRLAVPAGAPAGPVQFRALVVDVLSPDDNRVDGPTVEVGVFAPAEKPPAEPTGVPWWVWVIAAVVLVAGGFGIYQVVRPKGVPSVLGKTAAAAQATLTKAGFAPVTIKDTIDAAARDTTVVNQVPAARSPSLPDSLRGKTPAVIVVNRPPTTVPAIAGVSLSLAIERLRQAGLSVGDARGLYTPDAGLNDKIAEIDPAAGTTMPKGGTVDIRIWSFSPTPPCTGPRCFMAVRPEVLERIRNRAVFRPNP